MPVPNLPEEADDPNTPAEREPEPEPPSREPSIAYQSCRDVPASPTSPCTTSWPRRWSGDCQQSLSDYQAFAQPPVERNEHHASTVAPQLLWPSQIHDGKEMQLEGKTPACSQTAPAAQQRQQVNLQTLAVETRSFGSSREASVGVRQCTMWPLKLLSGPISSVESPVATCFNLPRVPCTRSLYGVVEFHRSEKDGRRNEGVDLAGKGRHGGE